MTLEIKDWEDCKKQAEIELKQGEIVMTLAENKLFIATREILKLNKGI